MVKKTKSIPNKYFEDQDFEVDDIDENLILGILGKNPSPDQILKFELCSHIAEFIDSKGYSLSKVKQLTGVNPSDISRIKNHHLERFTIDKLIKISTLLDNKAGVGQVLSKVGEKISKLSA